MYVRPIDENHPAVRRIVYGIWKFGETKKDAKSSLLSESPKWNENMKGLIKEGYTHYSRFWVKKGDTVKLTLYKDDVPEKEIIVAVDKN